MNKIINILAIASLVILCCYEGLAGSINQTNDIVFKGSVTVQGGGNVVTNAQVSTIVTYVSTNPVLACGEGTNALAWIPNVSNALSCTIPSPGAGKSLSGMLRFVNTNQVPTTWPTNATWFVNGTRTTNPPAMSIYNRIVIDWWDGMLTLGVVSTNATSL